MKNKKIKIFGISLVIFGLFMTQVPTYTAEQTMSCGEGYRWDEEAQDCVPIERMIPVTEDPREPPKPETKPDDPSVFDDILYGIEGFFRFLITIPGIFYPYHEPGEPVIA